MKKLTIALIILMSMSVLSACGKIPANSVNNVKDLEGKKIGVQLGTTGDIYASDVNKAKIERFNKGADAVQSLKQGKLDAVIIDSEPAKVFVEKNNELKILDEEFAVEDYAIAIAKGNTKLKDKINSALKTLKDNGTIDSIIKNYIGDSTKGKSPYKSPADVKRDNGTLTMATNAEFPPYEYKEGQKITGIDVDIAQAICDILGMELKIDNIKFDSIITAVTTGKADVGIAGMTVTEDRLKNIDFTDSYTTAKQVIIVRKK